MLKELDTKCVEIQRRQLFLVMTLYFLSSLLEIKQMVHCLLLYFRINEGKRQMFGYRSFS